MCSTRTRPPGAAALAPGAPQHVARARWRIPTRCSRTARWSATSPSSRCAVPRCASAMPRQWEALQPPGAARMLGPEPTRWRGVAAASARHGTHATCVHSFPPGCRSASACGTVQDIGGTLDRHIEEVRSNIQRMTEFEINKLRLYVTGAPSDSRPPVVPTPRRWQADGRTEQPMPHRPLVLAQMLMWWRSSQSTPATRSWPYWPRRAPN